MTAPGSRASELLDEWDCVDELVDEEAWSQEFLNKPKFTDLDQRSATSQWVSRLPMPLIATSPCRSNFIAASDPVRKSAET